MIDRFTARARRVLTLAKQEALSVGHNYVGTEHLLLALFHDNTSLASQLLGAIGINEENIRQVVKTLYPELDKTENTDIDFNPEAKRALELAVEESADMEKDYVGTEHILLALLIESESHVARIFEKIGMDFDDARELIYSALGFGDADDFSPQPMAKDFGGKNSTGVDKLREFGRNLNELARAGKIDPVVGRQKEIERLVQILCRRTKNNPVLIGEPGVGKTAIAEGLAQRIIDGKVPELLRDKVVFSLEMAALVAGTKYRGEFEERLKNLIDIIRQDKKIILFIDEMHTLIGAGAAEGSVDAANILKPALSRGEIQAIGATTLNEYKKYIEKDAALERRFQPVMVDVPGVEESIEILKGIRDKYEAFHKAKITDEALLAAVKLSDRYINDRNLPDKAIDIMDEACSRVRLKAFSLPPSLKEMEDALLRVKTEKEKSIASQAFEKAAVLRDEEKELALKLDEEQKNWKHGQAEKIVVNESDIADIIAQWTGIPVTKLTQSEAQRLLLLEKELHERVIGQNEAVSAVSRAIRRSRSGFHDPKRPVGSFLFLGPLV